ncbi:MAG: DUF86 domain-containing protein [Ignavibacteriae bacterium]|nr:DUF86 domain-containing protein [Ignavibacteriota bacterium]
MPSISDKDKDNLLNIIDSIEKIRSYVKDITSYEKFSIDVKTIDAVLMNFVVIGESVSKLSECCFCTSFAFVALRNRVLLS